ncbi:MAG: DUF389 domain-containing protein, partial [Cyanobacteria bacterium P01_A01_bin.135]
MPPITEQIRDRLQTWIAAVPILKLRASLFEDSQTTLNYLILIISSCLIATLGLIVNSAAVIIGAMIIAPLMLPLRGFAFAAVEGDVELLGHSGKAIALGTLLGISFSWLTGTVIGIPEFGSEVLSRTEPTLLDLLIAMAAGGISGYAKIRPELGDALPGTAIAVALMPPLCVTGLTLSQGQWFSSWGAFLLYATNLLGINLACMLVYVLAGYTRSNNQISRTLSWSISAILIGALVIPLGFSSWQLVRQARLNFAIRQLLAQDALLGREDIQVLQTRVLWEPPEVNLVVRAVDPITPEQVGLVERAVRTQMGQPFTVVFEVTQSTR